MAGGPSTPALAAAAARAGAFPFLAGGYLSAEQLREDIAQLERSTDAPYGVNLFVPDPRGQECDPQQYARYRAQLLAATGQSAALAPATPTWSDDAFEAKLAVVLESSAAAISFTFGHPSAAVVDRVHEADKWVVLYATSPAGIDAIAATAADALGIQGPNAGGHRASVDGVDEDTEATLIELIRYARKRCELPIMAGGGVADAADVRELIDEGATAVQVGTMVLRADEAGTKATHRKALQELASRKTVVTAAFTGKPARAIANRVTQELSDVAPAMYPQLHYLTAALRKQANEQGDAEQLNLWAGTGFAAAPAAPAEVIVAKLLELVET